MVSTFWRPWLPLVHDWKWLTFINKWAQKGPKCIFCQIQDGGQTMLLTHAKINIASTINPWTSDLAGKIMWGLRQAFKSYRARRQNYTRRKRENSQTTNKSNRGENKVVQKFGQNKSENTARLGFIKQETIGVKELSDRWDQWHALSCEFPLCALSSYWMWNYKSKLYPSHKYFWEWAW